MRTSEHDRASSCQPDTMVPALGVVGGTPGWAVRRIITRRSPPRSARFVHLRRTRTCSADRLTSFNYHKTSFLGPSSEKKSSYLCFFGLFEGQMGKSMGQN